MPDSLPRPSYDDLVSLVERQTRQIDEQTGMIAVLRAEIAELRRRLGMDSSNSSKPVCHEREGGVRM